MARRASAKQIAWRKKFASMVRSGKFKNAGRRKKKNVAAGFYDEDGVFHPIRASYDYSGKRAGESGRRTRVTRRKKTSSKKKRNPRYRTSGGITWTPAERVRVRKAAAQVRAEMKREGKLTPKRAGIFRRLLGLRRNPGAQHLPGLPAKYQRMYKHILGSTGSKRIAAATTRKRAKKRNSTNIIKTKRVIIKNRKGRSAKLKSWSYVAPKKRRSAKTGRLLTRGNPRRPDNPFRGRPARSSYQVTTRDGAPKVGKEAGKLKEMTLVNGKKYRFNGRAVLYYSGNRLHLGNIRFRPRAKRNPNEIVDLGQVRQVVYTADKPHLGYPKVEPYYHNFGEGGTVRPHLLIWPDGMADLDGGGYTLPPEGITG